MKFDNWINAASRQRCSNHIEKDNSMFGIVAHVELFLKQEYKWKRNQMVLTRRQHWSRTENTGQAIDEIFTSCPLTFLGVLRTEEESHGTHLSLQLSATVAPRSPSPTLQ